MMEVCEIFALIDLARDLLNHIYLFKKKSFCSLDFLYCCTFSVSLFLLLYLIFYSFYTLNFIILFEFLKAMSSIFDLVNNIISDFYIPVGFCGLFILAITERGWLKFVTIIANLSIALSSVHFCIKSLNALLISLVELWYNRKYIFCSLSPAPR